MATRKDIIAELRQEFKTSYLNQTQLMSYLGIKDKYDLKSYMDGVVAHVIGKTKKYHVGDIATHIADRATMGGNHP